VRIRSMLLVTILFPSSALPILFVVHIAVAVAVVVVVVVVVVVRGCFSPPFSWGC